MIARSIRASIALVLLASQVGAETSAPVSIDGARRALASGDAAKAVTIYESLTQQGESLEAELGLVRASLQAGEFRKAVSWATLTAGEHTDSSEAVALLAYLHDRAGYTEQALQTLKQLRADRPDDPMAAAALATVLMDRGGKASAADEAASRKWPRPAFQAIPAEKRHVIAGGNGIIVDGGRHVLTYSAVLPKAAASIYVRNGLGKVRRAVREAGDQHGELVRLKIAEPYPAAWALPKDQIASPDGVRFCFAFGYSASSDLDGGYPAISPGLVFRADAGTGGLMQITSALGAGHIGSPVFDPRGRLLGLSVGNGAITIDGENIRSRVGSGQFAVRAVAAQPASGIPPRPSGPLPPMPAIEELYERLAPSIVQIVSVQ
ncbi:MAG: trypsin-like peptidase domain-containing protein [Gammaproteobacteria bacterium]